MSILAFVIMIPAIMLCLWCLFGIATMGREARKLSRGNRMDHD